MPSDQHLTPILAIQKWQTNGHLRRCFRCEESLPLSEFYKDHRRKDGHRADCKECVKAASRKWRRDNPDRFRESQRIKQLQRRYGLSAEQYDDLLAKQRGVCAICGTNPEPDMNLAVDHCHTAGTVRGLLCRPCNSAIALLGEDTSRLRSAIAYLESQ